MVDPRVSVLIPAYNQAQFLGEAIQSVLDQTYADFELIIVNDASSDNTAQVVDHFNDPRIKYISHERNRGLPATRNTGIRVSKGDIIFLLDADDKFGPQKIEKHLSFLEANPEIGVTYNSRFEMRVTGELLSIWRPPLIVDFPDLVMGFPFSPSDVVIKRRWLFDIGLYDESYIYGSEDLDMNCRLALAGCKFHGLIEPLNYRRYYPNRIFYDVSYRHAAASKALKAAFCDPRCSSDQSKLRDKALSNVNMVWSYEALISDDLDLATKLIVDASKYDKSIFDNDGKTFIDFLVFRSNQDGSDHEKFINKIFNSLPPKFQWLKIYKDQVIARGYLIRAVRSFLWGDSEVGGEYLKEVLNFHEAIDKPFLHSLAYQLLIYEDIYGFNASQTVIQNLVKQFSLCGLKEEARWIQGRRFINKAFNDYNFREYREVPSNVIYAITNDPSYLLNRGVVSIFMRSMIKLLGH